MPGMKTPLRALLCLIIIQMTACTAVPVTAPVGRQVVVTRTSIAVFPVSQSVTQDSNPPLPVETLNTPELPPAETPLPVETPLPSATVVAPVVPVMPTQVLPQSGLETQSTPVVAVESFRKPWQYYSGTFLFQGPLIYRLRYPAGWFALGGEGGAAVLQNFPPGEGETISYGRIRVEISANYTAERGGFPAPNQKALAAGRPGTRQVLVDSARGVTVWNVRLYGLSESSAIFHLTGYVSGSPDPSEGVRLLDEILGTLELYAWTDPDPTPVVLDHSTAESWEPYTGRLQAGAETYDLRLRFPRGWWVYQNGTRWFDLTNWVLPDDYVGAQPSVPGSIKLSISAEPCTGIGGCPRKPGWLNNDMPGTREISQSPNRDTLWLVRIYRGQVRFTLSAILSGSEEQVQKGILALNMILSTIDIIP